MLVVHSDLTVATMLAAVVFGGVLVIASWVYRDARAQAVAGNPVECSVGTLRIHTPAGWFVACVLLFEVFMPVYLDSRRLA